MENEEYECEDFLEHCCDCYEYGDEKFYITTKGGRKIFTCMDFARDLHNQGEVRCDGPCQIDYWNCERTRNLMTLLGNQPLFRLRSPTQHVYWTPILSKCVAYSANIISVSPDSSPSYDISVGGVYILMSVENIASFNFIYDTCDVLKILPKDEKAILMLGCSVEKKDNGQKLIIKPSGDEFYSKGKVLKEELEFFAKGVIT